jgi:signal transduction histidine kinase
VTLAVDDSGPGIPADQRQLVLDRFHRADDTPGGTGLGLAIADAVVRSTEGTWSIGSSPLGGLRMEVSWRAAHEHRAGVDRRSTPDPPAMGPGLPTTASDVPS